MAYTASTDLNTLPKYYSKVFLERLSAGPRMMGVCMKKPLEQGAGTTIYFPRLGNKSTTLSAYKLTEATIITPEKLTDAQVSAVIEQFGAADAVTDITELTAINGTIEEGVKMLADHANTIIDTRILNEAYGTSATATGAGFSMFFFNTVGKVDLGASTSAGFTYAGSTEYRLKASTVRAGVAKLMERNVKPLEDGYYALVVHSAVAAHLQADSEWQTAYQYTDPENIRKGVAGTYAGAKIIWDNNIRTSANGSNGDTLYYNVLVGHGALGATELDGGVKFYTKKPDSSTTADPINQFSTIGWKANFVSKRLNVSCGLVVVTA